MKGLSVALWAALVCLSAPATADVFDLKSDWSEISNPNGSWTFREGSNSLPFVADWTPLSNYDPAYNVGGHIAQPAWVPTPNVGSNLPGWFKAAVTPASNGVLDPTAVGLDWQAGDVIVHTTDPFNGVGKGIASVLWSSPAAGIAHIYGNVWDARNSLGRTNHWDLLINGLSHASGDLAGSNADSFDRAHPASFDLSSVNLALGDTVELRVFRTGRVGDFVATNVTVDVMTPIPEPETYTMLLVGLVLIIGFARYARQYPHA
jgi:hypothetical protein